jgi:nitric oxide reductase subunit C
MARNIFYGGTVFFALLFLALTFDSMQAIPKRDNRANLTPAVIAGKKVWEVNNCIGCHTLLGEGAYFAPELGNVTSAAGPSSSRPGSSPSRRAPRAVARCPTST